MRPMTRFSLLSLLLFVVVCDTADAQLFRRLFRRRSGSAGSHVVSSRPKSELPTLKARYDYEPVLEANDENQVTVHMSFKDERFPVAGQVEVTVYDLSDSEATQKVVAPLVIEDEKAHFVVPKLAPAKVYRLQAVVYDGELPPTKESAVGSIPRYYYFATSSSEKVIKQRRKIVTSAFRYYDNFLSGQVGNMDCWAFCRRHSSQHIRSFNQRTHYGSSLPELAKDGPIFGDYVRIPDYHSLLLLAYDAKKKQVWTIEGNFNSSIVVVQRPLNSSWWVNHISDDNLRLLPLPPASSTPRTVPQRARRPIFGRRRT